MPNQAFKTLLLAASTVLATAAASHAAPFTLFNTGVNAAGNPAANFASEIHYALTSAPGTSTTSVRVATSANGFPIPPWVGDNSISAWIGPNSGGHHDLNGPTGTYNYATTFNLTGFQASTASIAGRWSADDAGLDILLNGVSTGAAAANYNNFYSFGIAANFVAGLNTLNFIVRNDGGPTGLRVEMTGAASRTPVPEPISLAVLGSGLLAIGVLRRKRA